jgi:hypothetical protein
MPCKKDLKKRSSHFPVQHEWIVRLSDRVDPMQGKVSF